MKTFRCRDTGMSCNAEYRANNERELMQKIEDHARSVHSMELHSDEAALQKVRQAIKNA